jgi:hypothetical protein
VNRAAEILKRWREKSITFVTEELKAEPDKWQLQALEAFDDPGCRRISLQACSGPGKSAVLAWMGLHFIVTQGGVGDHPKGAAVSITADNLKDNLWPEFAKWQARSELLKSRFTWNNDRLYCNDHPETWFISARSWAKTANAEEQGKTLSGLHSGYVLALVDESGAIPMTVARAAEQALSKCKWGKIVQAGNPLSRDGMLYAAATSLRHMWNVIRITGDPDDPNRSPRIDIEWAKQQISAYGRDNPWVQAYILGEFPPSSINVLLGPEEVEAAMDRVLTMDQYSYQQKRLGVDAAREGDDRTVLFPRQGLQSFPPIIMRNQRGPEVAARIALAKSKWNWETCFVDDTGGWGGSIQDCLQQGGHSHVPVNFAGKADDGRYRNRRAEMWFRMTEWVKRGGCLPKMAELVRELTVPTFTYVNGKFQIEPKDQIKKRLGFSPDLADALALTFAWAEQPASMGSQEIPFNPPKITSDFDPYKVARVHEMDPMEKVLTGMGLR